MTDLRDAMRAATKGELSAVDVPEWGQKVYIRKLKVGEQIKISENGATPAVQSLKILIASIVDENGEPQLTDDDLDLLMEQDFPTILPLLAEAAKINGFTTDEMEAAIASFRKAPGDSSSSE